MFTSPYETLACRAYDLAPVHKALKLARLEGGLLPRPSKTSPLVLVSPVARDVPVFAHPVFTDDTVVVDARGLIRVGRNTGDDFAIVQHTEFEFQTLRARLSWYALQHGGEDLASLGDLPLVVFARFVAENLVRRLGLGPEEQAKITMVAAFYYLCMFRSEEIAEAEYNKFVGKIARITKLPGEWIFQHGTELRYMAGLEQFVEVLKVTVPGPRTQNLSPAFIMAVLRGGWFGSNAPETMSVALEHAPTFLAMIVSCLQDRSYRKSGLGQMVLNNDRQDMGKQFLKNVSHLGA